MTLGWNRLLKLQTSVKPVEIVIWARNPKSSIFPNRNRNRNPRVLPLKQRGGLRLRLRLRLRLGAGNWSCSSIRLSLRLPRKIKRDFC